MCSSHNPRVRDSAIYPFNQAQCAYSNVFYMKRTTQKPIQSVDRALTILEQFSLNEKEFGLSELSKRTGLKPTTCYGLAETLLTHGYLAFNENTSSYRLGLKTFQLGQIYSKSIEIREIAHPLIMKLSDEFGQIAHLVVRDVINAVYVDKVGERDSFRIRSRVGMRAEDFCSAVSQTILTCLPEDELRKMLETPLKRFTANTITDPEEYLGSISNARENGYALDDECLEAGLCCVAAPVYDHNRRVVAAISMSGNSDFMHSRLDDVIKAVKACAAEVTTLLGG